MSNSVVAALIEPNLSASDDRTDVLSHVTEQVFAFQQPGSYGYLVDQRSRIVESMASETARAEFVLRGWKAAPAVDWGRWAENLELSDPDMGQIRGLALAVAAHVLEDSAQLRTSEAIKAASEHLKLLAPALTGLDEKARDKLGDAAREALAAKWAESEEELALQVARHELVRELEAIAVDARPELVEQRSLDVSWPIDNEEVDIDSTVLRGWRQMSEDLEDETYEQVIQAIPSLDVETQPGLFAEAMACRCVVMREGSFGGGFGFVKSRINEMKILRDATGQKHQGSIKVAASACVDLGPNSGQLRPLLAYIGSSPTEETKAAVRRWTDAKGKKPASTLIKDVMRFPMAAIWMPVFAQCQYAEAPILDRLEQVLFEEDNTVKERTQFAAALQALGLRTKTAPDRVGAAIAKLLNPARKNHHRNDRRVALILCGCLNPNGHKKHGQISKALVKYSKKWGHDYTPEENIALLGAGITLSEEYLSHKAKKGLGQAVEDVAAGAMEAAAGAGRIISKLSPFSRS